jgi:hypothetical protein
MTQSIETRLTVEDSFQGQTFGSAVSASDQYLIVAAIGDDDLGRGTGSAYIFRREAAEWVLQTKITAETGLDSFGKDVAINDDFALVGFTRDEYLGRQFVGGTYVFKRDMEQWQPDTVLISTLNSHHFGDNIAFSGDYAIMGDTASDTGPTNSRGAAYVYTHDADNWQRQAKVTPSRRTDGDAFGSDCAVSGEDLVSGAPGDDNFTGAAYVFKRIGNIWAQQSKLTSLDGNEGDFFGLSVSISGDFILVGANRVHVDDAQFVGAAYIFRRDGENWTQEAKLTAADAGENHTFGTSVSISNEHAAVGAVNSTFIGPSSGVYLFRRENSGWNDLTKLTSSTSGKRFGSSVAGHEQTVIVGDPSANADHGAGYIFDISNIVSVEDGPIRVPTGIELAQNYPNPFNPSTSIRYTLAERGHVVLKIFDLLGKEVRTLIDRDEPASTNTVFWDGTDEFGRVVSAGLYVYRLEAGSFAQSRKMLYLK